MKSLTIAPLILFCCIFLSPCYSQNIVINNGARNYSPYSYGSSTIVEQKGKYEQLYKEADYYYKLKELYNTNKNRPTPPTKEQLAKWNNSRLPHKLTQSEFSNGVVYWPEFFLIGQQPEVLTIDRAMAGEMGFWENMAVRGSILPLKSRLYEYRHLLSGNEKIRYMRFLEGLEAHAYYMEKK